MTTKAPDKTYGHDSLFQALAAAQAEMGPALKDRTNPAFKTKYADLASVLSACLPALNAHGIAVMQPPVEIDGARYVKTILAHESGITAECLVPLIIGKNDMQGYGSAVTYARRYGLMAMAGIAPDDDDGNAAVTAAPRGDDRQASNPIDDISAFTAAITSACVSLEMAEDADSLKRVWSGLRRDVQADAAVIKAKDGRKAELAKPASDAFDDIPYDREVAA